MLKWSHHPPAVLIHVLQPIPYTGMPTSMHRATKLYGAKAQNQKNT
jgi:hypothetical protein